MELRDDYLEYSKDKLEDLEIFRNFRVIAFYGKINEPLDCLEQFENIEEIYIRGVNTSFNNSLDKLPKKLKILHINNHNFYKHLNNLPETLEELQIQHCHYPIDIINLPKNLKRLILYNCVGNIVLPDKLEELYIYWKCNSKLVLPKSLKKLYFRVENYKHHLIIPESLKEIHISRKYQFINELKNVNLTPK